MDLQNIRRIIITAVYSDDLLLDKLVLKGGNALNLIHGIGSRTSLDVDFSMEEDFADVEEAKRRLFRALKDRFDSHGYVVFDETLQLQPPQPPAGHPWWGGYRVEFKLIEKSKHVKRTPNTIFRFSPQPVDLF
jgi:hypothetical protein